MTLLRQKELERLIQEALEVINEITIELENCESAKRRRSLGHDIEDAEELLVKLRQELLNLKSRSQFETSTSHSANVGTNQLLESEELEQKKDTLLLLENQLILKEMELNSLLKELRLFQFRYLSIVGDKFLELEFLEKKYETFRSKSKLVNNGGNKNPYQNSLKITEASKSKYSAQQFIASDIPVKSEENLKKVYRQLAKLVHPDLANDENDKARRTEIMTRINQAYTLGNLEELRKILKDLEKDHNVIQKTNNTSQLDTILKKIIRVTERMREIESKLIQLKSSNLYKLKIEEEHARKTGRNLFSEMAVTLDEKIFNLKNTIMKIDETNS